MDKVCSDGSLGQSVDNVCSNGSLGQSVDNVYTDGSLGQSVDNARWRRCLLRVRPLSFYVLKRNICLGWHYSCIIHTLFMHYSYIIHALFIHYSCIIIMHE